MPIIFNKIVEKEQPTKTAPTNEFYWDTNSRKMVKVEEKQPKPAPVIEKKVEVKTIEEPKEQYKHVHHGDLHKLFNTKSDYLKDMAVLENL